MNGNKILLPGSKLTELLMSRVKIITILFLDFWSVIIKIQIYMQLHILLQCLKKSRKNIGYHLLINLIILNEKATFTCVYL